MRIKMSLVVLGFTATLQAQELQNAQNTTAQTTVAPATPTSNAAVPAASQPLASVTAQPAPAPMPVNAASAAPQPTAASTTVTSPTPSNTLAPEPPTVPAVVATAPQEVHVQVSPATEGSPAAKETQVVIKIEQPAAPAVPSVAQPHSPVAPVATPQTSLPAVPEVASTVTEKSVASHASAATPAASTQQPVAPQAQQPEGPQEDLEIRGIDTVDLNEPQGNWLYKRIWWEKAERLYEKIKRLADQIAETRTAFFEERNALDRNVLDPFYLAVGLKQGELLQMTSYFIDQMQEERKEMGALSEQEQDLLTRLNDERKTLEQLHLSVQGISNVDHAIDDALMKLVDQINLARQYEKNAWEQFKEINRELSDKKAREHYYAMDSSWRNLNNINSYIADPFTQHFTQLIEKVNADTQQVKSVIGSLKEKGIDIKEQAQKLQKSSRSRREKPVEKPEEEEESGWLDTIWNIITAPFTLVWSGITGVFDWVSSWFGEAEPDVELAKTADEPQKE